MRFSGRTVALGPVARGFEICTADEHESVESSGDAESGTFCDSGSVGGRDHHRPSAGGCDAVDVGRGKDRSLAVPRRPLGLLAIGGKPYKGNQGRAHPASITPAVIFDRMSGRLEGKVAIVTGAGSGIGRVASELFAAEGAAVVVADVDASAAEATAESISSVGGKAEAIPVDVSDEEQVATMVSTATVAFGGLHVMFNCAGIFPSDDGGVLDTPPDTWDRVMRVNLKGVWLCCRAGLPAMEASGGGSIVNVASFVAIVGAATAQVAYTASKGGVLAFTRELAVEVARRRVRANSICPGPIQTPLLAELLSDPARRERRLVHIPMGRFGQAEEIAKAALFLASDDSSFMTGASLVVDGGITAAYVTPE
jgi:NAD(P)-dependent dehydrogenase (short-subunit alcohol dehydrogenase family)